MSSGESILEQQIGPAGPPPLRIHHILAATAVTAALLSVNEVLRQNDVINLREFLASGSGIVLTITTGIATTLVIYGIIWRQGGLMFFNQPGHWLLVQQALTLGIFVLAAIGGGVRLAGGNGSLMMPLAIYFIGMQLSWIGICFWAARRITDSRFWRYLFIVDGFILASAFGWQLFGQYTFSSLIIAIGPYATFLLLLLAITGDRRAGRSRDWPHWLGVLLRMSGYAVMLGQVLWSWIAVAE
jgi:hypothetical protein